MTLRSSLLLFVLGGAIHCLAASPDHDNGRNVRSVSGSPDNRMVSVLVDKVINDMDAQARTQLIELKAHAHPVVTARVNKLISGLGADSFDVRQRMAKEIYNLGELALPTLEARSGDSDLEIETHIKNLLQTPQIVLELEDAVLQLAILLENHPTNSRLKELQVSIHSLLDPSYEKEIASLIAGFNKKSGWFQLRLSGFSTENEMAALMADTLKSETAALDAIAEKLSANGFITEKKYLATDLSNQYLGNGLLIKHQGRKYQLSFGGFHGNQLELATEGFEIDAIKELGKATASNGREVENILGKKSINGIARVSITPRIAWFHQKPVQKADEKIIRLIRGHDFAVNISNDAALTAGYITENLGGLGTFATSDAEKRAREILSLEKN